MRTEAGAVPIASATGRGVLATTVLGSGITMLDSTVVNVALPRLGHDLKADLAGLQWTINGYTLALAALILLGGSLGDRFGRRRIFVLGTIWFAVASALCGAAPTMPILVAARVLQGIGGALLMPGSLALIQASFRPADRARAIGIWSGLGGVAAAVGPLLGGWLIDALSWHAVFYLNLPVAAVAVLVAVRYVPESRDPQATGRFDLAGAATGALGLAGLTYALISAPGRGATPLVVGAGAVGVAALVGFVLLERRRAAPMMPPELFRSVRFSAVNAITFCVYAALGGLFFFVVVELQVVARFSALEAGLAMLPLTIVMLALSGTAGSVAQRIGPRLPLIVGPVLAGLGTLAMLRIGPHASYLTDVLPAALVLALGMTTLVAPLTATVLAAVEVRHAGVASGVNNAVARAAGMLAVAALPLVAGLSGAAYQNPPAFDRGFRIAVLCAAALFAAGGLLAVAFIHRGTEPAAPEPAEPAPVPSRHRYCEVAGPPVEPARDPAVATGPGPDLAD